MGSGAMEATISSGDQAPVREADEDVRALDDVGQRPFDVLGAHQAGDLGLGPVHALGAVDPQRPVAVAQNDIGGPRHQQALGHADAGHPGAVDDDTHLVARSFAHHLEGVQEGGQDDDAGGVVFMVQHRNPDRLPDAVLDGETLGRGDALQAKAPEGGGQGADDFHDLVGVLGLEGDGHRVHVGKGLVDDGLGLQLGERRQGPDVAVFIDRAAVGDQGDGVAPAGVPVGGERVLVDLPADRAHPGGVDAAEHRDVPDGHLALDPDEAAVAPAVGQGIGFIGHMLETSRLKLDS